MFESAYRFTDPKRADFLTDKFHEIWSKIRDSKLFIRKTVPINYFYSDRNTAKYQKQKAFQAQLEKEYRAVGKLFTEEITKDGRSYYVRFNRQNFLNTFNARYNETLDFAILEDVNQIDEEGNSAPYENVVDRSPQYNRSLEPHFPSAEEVDSQWSDEVITNIGNKFKDKFGIDFNIVSPEEADTLLKDANSRYNEQSGFYLGGKVYFVKGVSTTSDVFHEYAHPFIAAIQKHNPALYASIYREILSTSEGKALDSDVRAAYADDNLDENLITQEVMVRALTQNKNLSKGFIQKLLFAIRQMLRKAFGFTKDLSKLNENTTLKELGEIFISNDKFDIDTKVVSPDDVAQFNRDIKDFAEVCKEVLEHTEFSEIISTGAQLIKTQSRKVFEGKKSYAEAKKNLINNDVNEIATAASAFNRAANAEEDVTAKATDTAIAFNAVSRFTDLINKDIKRVMKDENIKGDKKLEILGANDELLEQYQKFLDYTVDSFNDLTEEVPKAFIDYLNNIRGKVALGQSLMKKVKVDAATQHISEILSPVTLDARARLNDAKKLYEANPEKAGAKAKYEIEKARLENRIFEVNRVNEYLSGKHGDVRMFPSMWSSIAQSDDPVLGAMGTYIVTAHNKSLERSRTFQRDMNKDIHTYLSSINTSNPTKAFEKFVYREKKAYYDEDGKLQEKEVISLINPYQNYQYALKKLGDEIKQAIAAGDENLTIAKKAELNELKTKWMHRRFTDEYYETRKAWDTPLGQKASEKFSAIQSEIDREKDMYDSSDDEDKEAINIRIGELHRQRRALYSLTDLQGNAKEGDDLEIAKFLKEQAAKSKDIYEYVPKMGVFQSAYTTYTEKLQAEGMDIDSVEYKAAVDRWISENTKVAFTDEYYKEIKDITGRIKELSTEDSVSKEIVDLYLKIYDLGNVYRDENGVIVGTDLDAKQLEYLSSLENRIEELKNSRDALRSKELSKIESEIGSLNTVKINDPASFTPQMQARLDTLSDEYDKFKNSDVNQEILKGYYQRLAELKNSGPTEYYFDALNQWEGVLPEGYVDLFQYGHLEIREQDANMLMSKDEHFKKWFLQNHKLGTFWDADNRQLIPVYKRNSIWNQPNPHLAHRKTITLSDGRIVTGEPATKYWKRSVKSKYITEKVVGKTVDANGAWLPRLDKPTSPFINKAYFNLNQSERDFADKLAKWYLDSQEGLEVIKPGYEIPRFYKDLSETGIVKEVKNKWSELKNKATQFQEGFGNFVGDASSYSQYARIPILGLGYIDDLDKVSIDLPTIIQKFAASSFQNQELQKAQPFARAVSEVLKDDTGNEAKGFIADLNSRFNFGNSFKNSGESTRKRVYDNFYRTIFEGEIISPNTPEWLTKISSILMGAAAFTSLSLNLPGGLKNWTSGSIQSFIKASGGKDLNLNTFRKGEIKSFEYINALIRDKQNTGQLSMYSQLFDAFDPTAGKERHEIGKRVSGSYSRDFFQFKWLHSPYDFGEYQIGISFWQGMMYHQKVEQKLSNGETRLIPYAEAFEKDSEGNPKLKEGIDEGWALGGDKFLQFKNKLHSNMQAAQGNYDSVTRPLAAKEISGKFFFFMRKYLVPGLTNRFGRSGINVQSSDADVTGYYITAFKFATSWMKSKAYNWGNLSESQKADVRRTATELGTSLLFGLLLKLLFGWNPDDKDKYKKLQENSWVTNMLIYQIMATKSETEQFIPLPSMGLQELVRMKNTPSIAFGHLDKWVKLLGSGSDYLGVAFAGRDPSILTYQRKSGIYDKGDSKALANLFRVFGYNGGTVSPEEAIKSFSIAQSRTK